MRVCPVLSNSYYCIRARDLIRYSILLIFQVLCSAFEEGLRGKEGRLQGLVHAAWGVYLKGGGVDQEDVVDSLVRIVKIAVKPFQPPK